MDPPDLPAPDSSWLEDIVERLDRDPGECWPAFEGLADLDEELRARVVEALEKFRERPGVRDLLRLLRGAARDPDVRSVAADIPAVDDDDPDRGAAASPAPRTDLVGARATTALVRGPIRIRRSLVTAIDGEGRATVMISTSDGGYRRTAAFRCDVRRGILDAVGEVEEEHPAAGRLIDDWIEQSDGDVAVDVPDLAVRLLEGCRRLSGPDLPAPIWAWLDATIGPMPPPSPSAATLPGPETDLVPDRVLPGCADLILEACPSWLDRSSLTLELAAEIALREAGRVPDPVRDAGAYRYLFEHTLIGRLDLYSRMLLWMGWVWHAAARPELSRPAFALAAQLSDDQYVVPSHPFVVALTTRSLRAAQAAAGRLTR